MPTFDELYDAELQKRGGKLGVDTASLKQQFSGPRETMGEAVKADTGGLAGLDFTNPSNLMNVLHHGVPMALQMAGTMAAGPEAGPLMRMLGSGAGSALGYLFQSGAEPLVKGQSSTVSPGGALQNFLVGAGTEGAAQVGGGAMRRLTGKSQMLSEGAAAEQSAASALAEKRIGAELTQQSKLADVSREAEATALKGQQAYDITRAGAEQEQIAKRAEAGAQARSEAEKRMGTAQTKVESIQGAVNRQILKHSDEALKGLQEDEVAKQVQALLQPSTPLERPTIETLSKRATPVRQTAQRSVRSVFSGLSQKFNDLLEPHYATPVPNADFKTAIDTEQAILAQGKDQVSKKMAGYMDDISSMDRNSALNVEALPPSLQHERKMLLRGGRMTIEQADDYIRKVAAGMSGPQGAQAAAAAMPPDVRRIDDIRKKLTGVVMDGSSSPVDKRVANRLISSIDSNLEPVLPQGVRDQWTSLRNDWHEANNVFSPTFKSMLFRADSPAAVADVLYGAAKGKPDRVLTVIGQTPKDEIPLLRSAFADRLTQGDVVKNVEGLDPRVFKALFPGTGFDDPKAWTEALGNKLDFHRVMSDPKLYAQWNNRFQDGLKSFGMKKYQAALEKAEQTLKTVKDPGQAMIDAMKGELTPSQAGDVAVMGKTRPDVGTARKEALAGELTPSQAGDVATAGMERPAQAKVRGEMEGMKTPLLGKRFQSYLEHRTAFHTAMALTTLGAIGGGILNHPIAASLPLIYLGGSRAASAMLANPAIAKLWYNALKSQNMEQAAFLFGRLVAAGLTETTRDAK